MLLSSPGGGIYWGLRSPMTRRDRIASRSLRSGASLTIQTRRTRPPCRANVSFHGGEVTDMGTDGFFSDLATLDSPLTSLSLMLAALVFLWRSIAIPLWRLSAAYERQTINRLATALTYERFLEVVGREPNAYRRLEMHPGDNPLESRFFVLRRTFLEAFIDDRHQVYGYTITLRRPTVMGPISMAGFAVRLSRARRGPGGCCRAEHRGVHMRAGGGGVDQTPVTFPAASAAATSCSSRCLQILAAASTRTTHRPATTGVPFGHITPGTAGADPEPERAARTATGEAGLARRRREQRLQQRVLVGQVVTRRGIYGGHEASCGGELRRHHLAYRGGLTPAGRHAANHTVELGRTSMSQV